VKRQLVSSFLTLAVIFFAGLTFIALQVRTNNSRIGHLIHTTYPLLNRCSVLASRIDRILTGIYRHRLEEDKDLSIIIAEVGLLDRESAALLSEEELGIDRRLKERFEKEMLVFEEDIHQAVVAGSPEWTENRLDAASVDAARLKEIIHEIKERGEKRFVEESLFIERSLSGSTLALGIVLFSSLAFSLIALTAAVRGVNSSLARFLEVVRHLSEGDFSFRLGDEVKKFPSEFQAIAGSVNALADRLLTFHRAEKERLSEANVNLSAKNEELAAALVTVREITGELHSSREELARKVEHLEALHLITEFGLDADPREVMKAFLNVFFPRYGFRGIWIVEVDREELRVVASLARGSRKAEGGILGTVGENPDLPRMTGRGLHTVIDVSREMAGRNSAMAGMEGTTLLCLSVAASLPFSILAFHPGSGAIASGTVDELSTAARTLGLVLENRALHADLAVRVRDLAKSNEELERVNRELRGLDQMKDGFISSISHELRTPLSAIKGAIGLVVELLADPASDLREATAFVDIASRNCDRLIHLINEILDLSRIQSGRILVIGKPVLLAHAIDEAIEVVGLMAREQGVVITVRKSVEGVRLWADPMMVRQIFVNLFSNAVKFSREGGKVTVDAACETDQPFPELKHRGTRRYLQVTVGDRGIGIGEGDLEKVFDHFYQVDMSSTRSRGGAGLGLAITRGMVESLGGAIWAESRLGEGSDFHLLLPLANEGEEDAE
jgi:signal transduction histidine kinase